MDAAVARRPSPLLHDKRSCFDVVWIGRLSPLPPVSITAASGPLALAMRRSCTQATSGWAGAAVVMHSTASLWVWALGPPAVGLAADRRCRAGAWWRIGRSGMLGFGRRCMWCWRRGLTEPSAALWRCPWWWQLVTGAGRQRGRCPSAGRHDVAAVHIAGSCEAQLPPGCDRQTGRRGVGSIAVGLAQAHDADGGGAAAIGATTARPVMTMTRRAPSWSVDVPGCGMAKQWQLAALVAVVMGCSWQPRVAVYQWPARDK